MLVNLIHFIRLFFEQAKNHSDLYFDKLHTHDNAVREYSEETLNYYVANDFTAEQDGHSLWGSVGRVRRSQQESEEPKFYMNCTQIGVTPDNCE